MNEYRLHFRERDTNNQLNDIIKTIQTNSQKEAMAYGKSIENEEECFWFIGLIKE